MLHKNITVIFLDAHGENTNTDHYNIAPLERELNFILPKMGQDQLLIVDDYFQTYPEASEFTDQMMRKHGASSRKRIIGDELELKFVQFAQN